MLGRFSTTLRLVGLGIALLGMLCAKAPAQTGTNTVNGVDIAVSFSKTELVVGEPLYLRVQITNREAPLIVGTFQSKLYFSESNDVQVMVQPPGELPYRYVGVEQPGVYTIKEDNVPNGESMHHDLLLLYDSTQANGYVFSKPGEYVLSAKVSYSVLRDPLKSTTEVPPTHINVKAPEGKAAEAFKLIDNPEAAKSIHILTVGNKMILENAKKLSQNYPETPYAPLCMFLVGADLLRKDPPDAKNALGIFREFVRRYPNNTKNADAFFNLALCYFELKNYDLARAWFFHLMDVEPGYSLLRRETPLARFFYYNPASAAIERRWWLYERPWDIIVDETQQAK